MLRTLLWGLFWIAFAWWIIKNPQQAGQDVSHILNWFGYAFGQLSKFVSSI